jgi:hypothetical protein
MKRRDFIVATSLGLGASATAASAIEASGHAGTKPRILPVSAHPADFGPDIILTHFKDELT